MTEAPTGSHLQVGRGLGLIKLMHLTAVSSKLRDSGLGRGRWTGDSAHDRVRLSSVAICKPDFL